MTPMKPMPFRSIPSPRANTLALSLVASALVVGTLGCEQPNPLARAEAIGEYPEWGVGFQQPAVAADDSLVLTGNAAPEGRVPSGEAREGQKGGAAIPGQNPMAGEDWSGGDAALGKTVFLNNCALCHGADGRGGTKMSMEVPTLRNAGWHDKVDDNFIASTVSHGKGQMPSFMGKLDKAQLSGVVAYVRTLKAKPADAAAPASAPAPVVPKPEEAPTPVAPTPVAATKEAADKPAAAKEGEKKDEEKKEDDADFGEGW